MTPVVRHTCTAQLSRTQQQLFSVAAEQCIPVSQAHQQYHVPPEIIERF